MSAPTPRRVFLSAASTEFRPLRESLAILLLRSGIDVEYQEIFPQTAADTVRKLADLIKDCALLLHIAGHNPGSIAESAAVADLLAAIPPGEFLTLHPDLRIALGDLSGITYTQWEAFLALHHRVPVFLYAPADAFDRATGQPAATFAQKDHLARLLLARRYPEPCADHAQFIGKMIADVHRHFRLVPPTAQPQNLPYASLGPLFKGRAPFLADLGKNLTQPGATVIRTSQAIHGLGGVGKTRAAIEYAWAHAADYSALLFVTADSADSLQRHLAALAGPGILDLPEKDARETDAQLHAVLDRLHARPGWLLILDNADTPDALAAVTALLPRLADGHVLITSRLADWPPEVHAIDLDVLPEAASIDFLLERTAPRRIPAADDPATAGRIVRLLDRLALALEQSAAYIRHRRCTLADFERDWESKRPAVLAWHDPAKSHYPHSLAVTWQTSVDQLSPGARALFQVLAWLAPDPIPTAILGKMPPPAGCESAAWEPATLLGELLDLHLATLTTDGATCTIHRLLQEITRQQQPEEKPPALLTALAWVNGEMPNGTTDVRTWPVAVPLVPHAIATATFAADRGIVAPTGRLLNQAAVLLNAQANHRAAEPLMRRALAAAKAEHGPEHPEVAPYINNLATLLQATNRLAEAEPLMRRALAIWEANLGPEHPDVAAAINNLATLLQATNRLAEAEPLKRRALAIWEASFGPVHPNVARALNNLAQLLQATNRLAEAEPLLRRALASDEASFGPEHPTVAIRLNNLATLYYSTHRLAEAEPLMRRALASDEVSFGPEHPDVARDLNNLAQLLQATHRLAEAEPLMRRALAIWEASLGPEHPNVAGALSLLARLLQSTNRLAEAEPLLRRALAILVRFTRETGHQHPHLMDALNNYAGLLIAMGRTEAQVGEAVRALAAQYGVTL